jgi:hypothetical protein
MDEMAKEIQNALDTDFPSLKLKHAPHPGPNGEPKPTQPEPTLTAQIDALIAGLRTRISYLEKLRATL